VAHLAYPDGNGCHSTFQLLWTGQTTPHKSPSTHLAAMGVSRARRNINGVAGGFVPWPSGIGARFAPKPRLRAGPAKGVCNRGGDSRQTAVRHPLTRFPTHMWPHVRRVGSGPSPRTGATSPAAGTLQRSRPWWCPRTHHDLDVTEKWPLQATSQWLSDVTAHAATTIPHHGLFAGAPS